MQRQESWGRKTQNGRQAEYTDRKACSEIPQQGYVLGEGNGKKELKKKIPSQEKWKALLPKALAELYFINIYKAFRDSQIESTADMTGIITDL